LSGLLDSGGGGGGVSSSCIVGVSVHVDVCFFVRCFQYYGFISLQFSVCGK
jgi:hypothetical protein